MPEPTPELTALQIKTLSASGRNVGGCGNGLDQTIPETGARSWILRATVDFWTYRWAVRVHEPSDRRQRAQCHPSL